ncbi:hypothetical protein NHQ30_002605 [Ciborinia camelliae]|nr:hypothetical protein NHQ30_002605 [Ciborinia camelliae]
MPPALLRYSIATNMLHNSSTPPKIASIKELLDKLYNESDKLESDIQKMSLGDVLFLGHMHDIIDDLVMDFSTHACKLDKARAKIEILTYPIHSDRIQRAKRHLLSWHPPWENEQVGCIRELIHDKILKIVRDVLAHADECRNYPINYDPCIGNTFPLEDCSSQGIEFLHRLMKASSYKTKAKMLNLKLDWENLGEELHEEADNGAVDHDEKPLQDFAEEELNALVPRVDPQDTDEGPNKAWRIASFHLPRRYFFMWPENIEFRRRAYVLWDMDRLQKYNLLSEKFGNAFEVSREHPLYEDYNAMENSWEE